MNLRVVTKSLSHLKSANLAAAGTPAVKLHSAEFRVFVHAFDAQNDPVQANPVQSGCFGCTATVICAVKDFLQRNSAQPDPLISHVLSKQALLQIKLGAEYHMKKSRFHHAAMSNFHETNFLAQSHPLTGLFMRFAASSRLHEMCAWHPLSKKAYSYSAKYGLSCKGSIEISRQIKWRSLVALPYISPLRAFCTESPIPKYSSSYLKQPREGLAKIVSHYKQAVCLQIEAFWRRNLLILVGAAGVLSCYLLWCIMYGVASVFISVSERMARFGLLAMAASTVALTAIILRNRFTINPDKVYRIVMRTLNTSSKALEVLGAPLTGSGLRAYVMSGGGLRLKNFRPTFSRKRCFLMFPVQGSERRGLVSVEVKKKKGKHDFKLIAIDVAPAAPGSEQRVFIVADETEYKVGGGLMAQLRTPILKVIAAQKEFDALDEKEAEEEDRAEATITEQESKEEVPKLGCDLNRMSKRCC